MGRASQDRALLVSRAVEAVVWGMPTVNFDRMWQCNWVPTDRAGRFEVLFRCYGPTPELLDKSWRLPDVTAASA